MIINEANPEQLTKFFGYLNRQLAENIHPLFQPLAREHCYVSDSIKKRFIKGFNYQLGQSGWRKLWLAWSENDKILGHIDLRHYSEAYKSHRLLLGMGVDSNARQQGLGMRLVQHVINFCQQQDNVDWLDLNVLSNNIPAKNLYLKAGFEIVGEVNDCYRIDGEAVAETSMTLNTRS
ncbi:GNAT family N-acetyltransferase [Bacterioplanes sanyensis]|uniref:GNAT family N-acetyltransferase n=1 Tax=Bacterioplanes sanyensis TaxID=1249553 RepID=UPI001E3E7819|nr:GNAT family N-acetyltransferase [Bacterioplanes sanyensis]